MALSISSDLTIITSAETGDAANWTDLGGGGGSIQETDFSVQGSQCRSRAVSGAGGDRGSMYDIAAVNALDFTVSGANEDELVYMWIATFAPGLADALSVAPGLTIRLASGTDPDGSTWSEWDILYSDLLASEGTEFFKMYVLDPRAPPTRISSSACDLSAVRWFGSRLNTNATAKGQNWAMDQMAHGFGELIATGTATDAASGLQELVDNDWDVAKTNRRGILVADPAGNVQCKGKLVIGDDAGTASTAFTAQGTSITWAPTFYYDGTRIRPTIGYDSTGNWTGLKSDGSFYFGIDIRGNGTGDTDATSGAAVGSVAGRSGPTLRGSRQIPTGITCDDGAVEDVAWYATTFIDIRSIDMASNASTDKMFSCTLSGCGALDIGPVEGLSNTVVDGLGGAYTFLEYFTNKEASAAEQLSTADPITEWTDSLNGTDWSVPSATVGYVELLGGTTRTNLTILDDDKMGSDNHYVDCVVRFPAAGAGQGTLGPVIACHLTVDDYFWVEVDLASDTIELFRVNTGTATSIAGPTAFTMDEDENYQILLRRNGTTIEAYASGVSVADGLHTTKLSATDSAHTGTAQRLVGLRGDALAGQTGATGERPRVRLFGAGPITDNLGSMVLPATGDFDFSESSFINCARALSWDTTGTYTITKVTLSGNLVDAHNDSGGLVTGNITGGTLPLSEENLGASTSAFNVSVNLEINGLTEGSRGVMSDPTTPATEYLAGYADSTGKVTGSFTGSTPQAVDIKARNAGIVAAAIQNDSGTGFTDFTNEARDAVGVDDVDLLPATVSVGDEFYTGGLAQFANVDIEVTTAGTTYVGVWEYWNGAWVTLTLTADPTNDFQTAGWGRITFDKPGDWATTTVNSQGPFYYIKFRVTTGGGTQPQAEEINLGDTIKYQNYDSTGTIVAETGLTNTAVWNEDTLNP